MDEVLKTIIEAGIATASEGALVVDVGDDIPPCLLKKKRWRHPVCYPGYYRGHLPLEPVEIRQVFVRGWSDPVPTF